MIDEEDETTAPFVSAIIPVYANHGGLGWCLAALRRQRYPAKRLETIVVRGDRDRGRVPRVPPELPQVGPRRQEISRL